MIGSEWFADAPPGWRTVPLRSMFRRRKVLGFVDEPMVSVFRDHGVVFKDSRDNLNKTAEDRSIYQLIGPGWLVVNRMKAWQGSVGVSAIRGIVSGHYICFEPTHGENSGYLNHLLRSPLYATAFAALSRGVRNGQIEIDNDDLGSLGVLLPPVEEQRRIARFLDDQTTRIDQIITARQRQMDLIASRGRASVASALLGGGWLTADPERAWYQGLPGSWHVRPLRTEWSVIDCKHRTPAYLDSGYPVVSPGDIAPVRLDLTNCHRFVSEDDYIDLADDLRRCRRGDIVYSRNASAGTAAYVETAAPFTMGQDVCRITSGRSDQKYLFHVLNHVVEPQLESVRIGSTITRVNIDQIKSLLVPVPSDSEQYRLADEADRVAEDTQRGVMSQQLQIALLQEFKRSLISAAVSGEFDVISASGRGVPA